MDIQDAMRKLRNETTRQKSHVAGQANQIDSMLVQIRRLAHRKHARSMPLERKSAQGRPSSRARARAGSFRLVRKHQGDLARKASGL